MKTTKSILVVVTMLVTHCNMFAQQADTSSYFPLGFWGIWIDQDAAPYNPQFLTSDQWRDEKINFMNAKGNYLLYLIPEWMENQVMQFADTSVYQIDISRSSQQNSLSELIQNTSLTFNQFTTLADQRVQDMVALYGTRDGLYSYSLAHEKPVVNYEGTAESLACVNVYWPRLNYVVNRLKQVDPNSHHKSYAVAATPPSARFAESVPNLDILQCDWYVFQDQTAKSLSSQQAAFDVLRVRFDTTNNRSRNRVTEWQAIIQAQREYPRGPAALRRPTFEEMKAQAYLALTRGSRGITAFVYGSDKSVHQSQQGSFLSGGRSPLNPNVEIFDGIVDDRRDPFTSINDADNIPVFENVKNLYVDLAQLGPTLRKLRHYNYFAAWTLQNPVYAQPNSAHIDSIWTDYYDPIYFNYIHVGTFKRMDQGADSTNYFVLANLVCNKADGSLSSSQNVSVRFNYPESKLITEVVSGQAWVVAPNNGSFAVTLNPGSGKLFKIEQATIGSRSFPQGLTVQSGATLTVQAGATLTFGQGKSLLSYGVVSALGTSNAPITFTSSSPSSTWSGITLDGGGANGSTLEYVTVEKVSTYGGAGVSINNATNTSVRYCNISNNAGSNGVSVTNGGSPQIAYNTINANGRYGLYFYNTNGNIYGNTIENNTLGGMQIFQYSSPAFGKKYLNFTGGNNKITGGNYGVWAQLYSNPYLGSATSTDYGYNAITQNATYRVYAVNYCNVIAEQNWWGSASPNGAWFNTGNPPPTSTIVWNPYLSSDPFVPNMPSPFPLPSVALSVANSGASGPAPNSPGGLNDSTGVICSAIESRVARDFHRAKGLLKSVISARPTTSEALHAVVVLLQVYRDTSDADIFTFVRRAWQQHRPSDPVFKLVVGKMLAMQSQVAEAAELFSAVAASNPNTLHEKSALLDLFYLYFAQRDQRTHTILEALQARYGADDDVQQAAWLSGVTSQSNSSLPKPQERTSENERAGFLLSQNYPNPFNPTTTMKYDLPDDGHVVLKVYDVLGREVLTLVDEEKKAGYHTTTFDASGFSSGVYFYRIQAGQFSQTKKLMLLR